MKIMNSNVQESLDYKLLFGSFYTTSFRGGTLYYRISETEFICVDDDSKINIIPVLEEGEQVFYINGRHLRKVI